jgi:hypothetical protein
VAWQKYRVSITLSCDVDKSKMAATRAQLTSMKLQRLEALRSIFTTHLDNLLSELL